MLLRHKRRWGRGRRPGPGRVRRRYLVAGQAQEVGSRQDARPLAGAAGGAVGPRRPVPRGRIPRVRLDVNRARGMQQQSAPRPALT
jgi:hypothetical protein